MTAPPLRPPPGPSRGAGLPTFTRVVLIVLGAVVVLVLGGAGVRVLVHRHYHQKLVALEGLVDLVPLPPDARRTDQDATQGDLFTAAFVSRNYTLPSSGTATSERIHQALLAGHVRIYDPQIRDRHRDIVPIANFPWSAKVSANSGDLYVLPAGTTGGGVDLNWSRNSFFLQAGQGDIRRSGG